VVNSTDKIGCAPFTVPFQNNSGGADKFLYDFGDGTVLNTATVPETVDHVFTKAGIYTVTLTASNDCSTNSTTETITVLGQPEPSFVSDVALGYPGLEIHFANTTTDAVTYLWDFGDGGTSTLSNPSHVYAQLGEYTVSLTVTNLNNCPGTTSQKITIAGQPGFIFVPNAFIPGSTTPEFQLFKAKGYGVESWRFSIFNKWGELLWETTKLDNEKPAEGWDGTYKGKLLDPDVYVYHLRVTCFDAQENLIKGNITLLR
jgi:gliding motility-associated-like protein